MQVLKGFYASCVSAPPLTPMVIIMRGLIFQPCALIAFTNGLDLSSFVCMAWSRNLSCVKVK